MVGTSKKSDLLLVPEPLLKKRHDLDALARKRAASEQHLKKTAAAAKADKKAFYVRKPETFLARGRSRRNNAVRYRRVQKKGMQKRASNKKQVATKEIEDGETTTTVSYQSNSVGAPMVFCVRIRDDSGVPKVVKRVLQGMRLNKIHEGVFLRYDEDTRKQLHLVEPFVVYGYPSQAVVTDLIERRGYGNVNHERVPLSDNTVIENALGEDTNIICVEDLVHELHTAGEAFAAASEFLWPFQLVDTKSDFERGTLRMKDGKDYGDRGEAINEYIKQVL